MVLPPRQDGGLGGPMKATLYTALHFLPTSPVSQDYFIGKENTYSIFKEVKQFVPGPPLQAYSTRTHHDFGAVQQNHRQESAKSQQARPRLPSLLARSVTSIPEGLCLESAVKHHTLIL